jgi:AraC-like DNA-binding protein
LPLRDGAQCAPLAVVARRAGFASASHFSVAFGRRVGVAPHTWRAQRSG